MRNILKILRWPRRGQQSPLPEAAMVPNDAGGYCHALDQWERLDRFLVLGTESETYYASERKLTAEAAKSVMDCLAEDGNRAVARIVEMSVSGRAPKQDPVLFALSLATASAVPATRALALGEISRVARTGAQLQRLAGYIDGLRGCGRGLRRAVAKWCLELPLKEREVAPRLIGDFVADRL